MSKSVRYSAKLSEQSPTRIQSVTRAARILMSIGQLTGTQRAKSSASST